MVQKLLGMGLGKERRASLFLTTEQAEATENIH
jgi:hypothetical protein